MATDIRWKQRFNNYLSAFRELQDAVALSQQRMLSKLEKQGLIQGFEYTHELAWNVLKDFLTEQGLIGLIGSKDSTLEAFKNGLITRGEIWMEMIKARNLTSHSYDEAVAEDVVHSVVHDFFPAFARFTGKFTELHDRDDE